MHENCEMKSQLPFLFIYLFIYFFNPVVETGFQRKPFFSCNQKVQCILLMLSIYLDAYNSVQFVQLQKAVKLHFFAISISRH